MIVIGIAIINLLIIKNPTLPICHQEWGTKFFVTGFCNLEAQFTKAINHDILPYLPSEEEIYNNTCLQVPIGVGIPGFKPGISKERVLQMFGVPSQTLPGYWPNTNALVYDLIPEEVSLGFLFDKDSDILRQTEAAFAKSVKLKVILETFNSMLGCQLNKELKQGLQKVWQRQESEYYFVLDSLEGVIEWEERGRLYIGIWQEDLH